MKYKEKLILAIPVMLLCIITAVYSVNTSRKLDSLQNVSAVVIHDVPTTKEAEKNEMTVFISPSGKKYHLDGCKYVSDKAIKTNIGQAIISGYEPCALCQP